MVYKHPVSYLERGRTPCAVPPGQLTFTNVFQVSSSYGGQVLLVFQPIPYGDVLVLKKQGFAKPRRDPPWSSSWGV